MTTDTQTTIPLWDVAVATGGDEPEIRVARVAASCRADAMTAALTYAFRVWHWQRSWTSPVSVDRVEVAS